MGRGPGCAGACGRILRCRYPRRSGRPGRSSRIRRRPRCRAPTSRCRGAAWAAFLAFVFAGVALLERLSWLTFLFGAFLVFTGELTDVVFAVDSIPAVLAVSRSTFIVFSSNVFAILGLRSLFFVLAGFQDRLVHLNKGLGVVLGFVGVKMLVEPWFPLATAVSLAVIALILAVTVALSLRAEPEAVDLPVDRFAADG